MDKHAAYKAICVILVLALITDCNAIPLRVRRQVQDLVHLHDAVSLQDYDDGNYHVDDQQDDTSHLSPLDDLGSDDLHQTLDDLDIHGNSTESTDDAGLAHEPGADGSVHELDIIHSGGSKNDNAEAHQVVAHALHDVGNLDENAGALHPDTDFHQNEQLHFRRLGHISSSGQSTVHTTLESHDRMELPAITRRTNNSNGQRLVLDSVDRGVNHINVSTYEQHETHHGFLMVDNIQNIENEQARLNSHQLTSKSTTLGQTATTTRPEQFITVKILNISSGEGTESSAQEHIPISGVIIRQNNGAHSDHGSDIIDSTDHMHEDGLNTSTEMPQSHDGHVAMLPGEPHVPGSEHEEHLSGHEESEEHHPGIDVPIDKGDHRHGNHEEEHVDPGSPRHTNNPVLPSPSGSSNSPTEPTNTTPKLIILPTPAQLEPEERNTSAENAELQSSVSHPGVENEHTESYHESAGHIGEAGESHIHGNSGQGNHSEERLVTAGEGHIELITEVPEIPGENELKPNKHITKDATRSILPSVFRSSQNVFETKSYANFLSTSEMILFTSEMRLPLTMEDTLTSSATSYLPSHSDIENSHVNDRTVFPQRLQSSELNRYTIHTDITSSETVSSFLQSDIGSKSQSSVSKDSMTSSLPVQQIEHSAYIESSTPYLSKTPSVTLFEDSTSALIGSNEPLSTGVIYNSSAGTIAPVEPSQSEDHSKKTDPAKHNFYIMSAESSVTSMPMSWLSSIPFSSGGLNFNTSPSLPFAPTPHLESTHGTEEFSWRTVTPVTTPSTSVSVKVSALTSSPTTKKNSTSLVPTTFTTRKKPDAGKGEEKPEIQSPTTTRSSMGSTTRLTSIRTFSSTFLSVVPVSTQKPVLTTPPSLYIEIELRMDWSQFCVSRSQFISEIKEIIRTEKGYTVDEERFKMITEDCDSANSLLDGASINSITIKMYMVDNDGKLDVLLTKVTFSVISKGFSQSNYLKDKIVSMHTVGGLKLERLPDHSRAERRQAPPAVTMVIVIATVGGVCCVALIILQVLIHRRVKAKRKQRAFIGQRASLQSMDHVALGVIPKSRPNSGYWNPALDDTMELPEPEEHSHILNFSGLANFCMDTQDIYAEFQTIPFDDAETTNVPVGEEDKNRFANVLPHKHSRVSLKINQENKSGYMNANHVDGYMGEKKVYIATQSPLVNTAEDFWRMVWEQQSRTILMLNPVTQQGKPKQSTCYWPDNLETDCRREFGDYIVTLKKRDVQQDYIDCTLEIMDIERNLKREVHHFWFTCWSDTGPPEPLTLVKFVLDTRPHFENTGSPLIVHCGPGTGRTGVYIAVDMCMRMFEDRRRVDIQKCVHKMRSERAGAVQTKEQYKLIYQALNEYAVILSSPSISTRSSVITLHAML